MCLRMTNAAFRDATVLPGTWVMTGFCWWTHSSKTDNREMDNSLPYRKGLVPLQRTVSHRNAYHYLARLIQGRYLFMWHAINTQHQNYSETCLEELIHLSRGPYDCDLAQSIFMYRGTVLSALINDCLNKSLWAHQVQGPLLKTPPTLRRAWENCAWLIRQWASNGVGFAGVKNLPSWNRKRKWPCGAWVECQEDSMQQDRYSVFSNCPARHHRNHWMGTQPRALISSGTLASDLSLGSYPVKWR